MKLRILYESPQYSWQQILSRFPKDLRSEILDERPGGDQLDIEEIQNWQLRPKRPLEVSTKKILATGDVEEYIRRIPQEAINIINRNIIAKKWGKPIQGKSKSLEKDASRYIRYSRMPASTAKPSILVNGKLYWGVGRFIAALLRGDETVFVWNILNPN